MNTGAWIQGLLAGLGPWDAALILAVSIHATALAYLHHPRWKALLYVMPVPFTLATLALGRPVGATHVLGLPLMLLFMVAVRWLHVGRRVPIVTAIVSSAAGYCLAGALLARVVVDTDAAFWTALAGVFVLGLGLYLSLPHRLSLIHI